jgi:Family of unknown function (DUF6173)
MTDLSDLLKGMQDRMITSPERNFDFINKIPIPRNVLLEEARANHASEFHKRLVQWINDFDASLDEAHEVGVRLVSFGQAIVFHLRDIGYWNPSLISFSGNMDDGSPVDLIQHVSQISILLMKVPRKDTTKPKQPIGFGADPENAEKGSRESNPGEK